MTIFFNTATPLLFNWGKQRETVTCDEKIVNVATFLILSGCLVGIGALYFQPFPMSYGQYLPLGATALLSGSLFVVNLVCIDHRIKKGSFCQNAKFKKIIEEKKEELPLELPHLEKGELPSSLNIQTIVPISQSSIEERQFLITQPQNSVEKLIAWGTQKKSSKNQIVYNTARKNDFKEWLEKEEPRLLQEKEFRWLTLKNEKKQTAEKLFDDSFFNDIKNQLVELLNIHWSQASKNYPEGILESKISDLVSHPFGEDHNADSLLKVRFALFALAPFFANLYQYLSKVRPNFLPWLQENVRKVLEMDLFFVENKISPKFREKTSFFLSLILKLLSPFNSLLSESFVGKEFLKEFSQYLLFNSLDSLMGCELSKTEKQIKKVAEEAKNAIEICEQIEQKLKKVPHSKEGLLQSFEIFKKRMEEKETKAKTHFYINKVFESLILPFFANESYGSRERLHEYLCSLDSLYNEFSEHQEIATMAQGIDLKKILFKEKQLDLSQISDLANLINSIYKLFQVHAKEVFFDDFSAVFISASEKKAYTAFLLECKKAYSAVEKRLKRIFSEKVTNIGEFCAKSLLLSQTIPKAFTAKEEKIIIAKSFLAFVLKAMQKCDIEVKQIEEWGENEIQKILELASSSSGAQNIIMQNFPIQDVFLGGLLWGIFLAENAHFLLPFLKKHKSLFLNFLKHINLSQVSEHSTALNNAIGFLLSLLTPLNAFLLKKWPLKSILIKSSLSTLYEYCSTEIKDESQKKITNFVREISFFLLNGTFGNEKKHREVFQEFVDSLTTVYNSLYSFEIEKVKNNQEELIKHIKKSLNFSFAT